jgi:glycosyltransferase involved in cell wall biosynthesis
MAEVGSEILFLVDRPANRGDLQSLRSLADGLGRLGHDPSFLCLSAPSDHGLDDLTECPGLATRWQRPWAVRSLDLGDDPGKRRLMHVLSSSMAEAALAIAERWRIPYLLDVEEFPRRDFRFRLSRAWCRGLIVPNHELAGLLAREYGVPSGSIHEIKRGVAVPEGIRRAVDPGLGRVPVVGAAGPLVASSGFTTFLNAARKVVDMGLDAEFLIAGQGEDEGDLRRRAERLRIAERLTFADDLPIGLSFWEVLDVYCQTSMAPTVGRPLMTAMASGVPSIATDVEGLRSLVEPGETGLVVPHGDSSALAGSIVALLLDRDRARALGEAARQAISKDHHPDRETALLDTLYRTVSAGGLGPQDSGLASRIIDPLDGTVRGVGGLDGDAFPRLSNGS